MHFISSFFIPYIIIWECYLHCYINVLHVLDDLCDFHTKSLFLVFNIWEAEYPPFLVFIVSGVSRTQIIKGKIPRQFFHQEKGSGKKTEDRRATRAKLGGPTQPMYLAAWDPSNGASSTSSRGAFYQHLHLPGKGTP